MKRKITVSTKEIQAAKKAARLETKRTKEQVHPLELKTDTELIRLNLQLSTYLLNLPDGKDGLTQKDKDEWRIVRSILKKRGIAAPTKVVPRTFSKEVFLLVTRV